MAPWDCHVLSVADLHSLIQDLKDGIRKSTCCNAWRPRIKGTTEPCDCLIMHCPCGQFIGSIGSNVKCPKYRTEHQ
jgi:hypothetical protein